MSINWVMLAPSSDPPFTPLPGEKVLYTSPPRISFSITTPSHYPVKQQQAFSIASSSGHIYLTTRRLIYLPSQSTASLQSFASPFLNLHDSHVTAPWFGPNIWQALLQPVSNGNIPVPSSGVVELKLTFKEGGAFDFHTKYEMLKERAQQAQETGQVSHGAPGNVDLEDLPVYQEQSDRPLMPPILTPRVEQDEFLASNNTTVGAAARASHPSEPPPGYDESQQEHRPGIG